MTLGQIFWIIMILWAVFSFAWNRGLVSATYGPYGNTLLLFVLFLLLGWAEFGPAIRL